MEFNAKNNSSYYFYESDSEEENHTHGISNFGIPPWHPADDLPIKSSLQYRRQCFGSVNTPVQSQLDFPDYDELEEEKKYLHRNYNNKSDNISICSNHYDNYYTQEQGVHYNAPHHTGSGASSVAESDTESTGEGDSEAYGYVNGLESDSVFGQLDFEQFRWHMQQRIPNVHDDTDVLSVLNSTIQYIQDLTEAAAAKSQRLNSDSLSDDLYRLNFNECL